MKKSDDAAADVEGSGVMCADADAGVEACDVADDDAGVEACVVADDDADADACGIGEFHDITAGADDIDSVGDAEVGCCGEAISDSIRLRSCIYA